MTPIRDASRGAAGPSAISGADHAARAKAAATKDTGGVGKDIKQAAAQFEAILVRQMLQSASVAGKGSYADMGVEALSTAVTNGGGLGLGRAIEQAVGKAHHLAAAGAPDAAKKTTEEP